MAVDTDKPVAIYPENHKIKGLLRNKTYNLNELYSFSSCREPTTMQPS